MAHKVSQPPWALTAQKIKVSGGALQGVLASTSKQALHDGPEDRMERLDYVGLVTDLLAVRAHVEAQVSARAQ